MEKIKEILPAIRGILAKSICLCQEFLIVVPVVFRLYAQMPAGETSGFL